MYQKKLCVCMGIPKIRYWIYCNCRTSPIIAVYYECRSVTFDLAEKFANSALPYKWLNLFFIHSCTLTNITFQLCTSSLLSGTVNS